jgi:hypothetical protein
VAVYPLTRITRIAACRSLVFDSCLASSIGILVPTSGYVLYYTDWLVR